MASHNHLRRRAHADRISADRLPILILCGRLVGGTREAYVDTLLERQLLLLGDGLSERNQFTIVSSRHIGEADAKVLIVRTNERVGQHIDMIPDDHQVTHVEVRVDATRSIGDNEDLDAEELHHPHWQRDHLHRVALIVVKASLHRHHGDTAQRARDEVALVPDSGRVCEVGDLAVWDDGRVSDLVG